MNFWRESSQIWSLRFLFVAFGLHLPIHEIGATQMQMQFQFTPDRPSPAQLKACGTQVARLISIFQNLSPREELFFYEAEKSLNRARDYFYTDALQSIVNPGLRHARKLESIKATVDSIATVKRNLKFFILHRAELSLEHSEVEHLRLAQNFEGPLNIHSSQDFTWALGRAEETLSQLDRFISEQPAFFQGKTSLRELDLEAFQLQQWLIQTRSPSSIEAVKKALHWTKEDEERYQKIVF